MTARVAALLVATACTSGPSDLTRITDVRVVAAIAEPPEAAVGEEVAMEVVAVDPEGRRATLHVWQCLGDAPCTAFSAPLVGDRTSFAWPQRSGAPIWLLACRVDGCATLDDADRRDPAALLRRLPIDGVSAATTTVPVTDLPAGERRTNPVLAEIELPERVGLGDVVSVEVSAPGAAFVAPLTTAGGFSAASTELDAEGAATLEWFAPERPADAVVYVVVQDEAGGVAVARRDARVDAP